MLPTTGYRKISVLTCPTVIWSDLPESGKYLSCLSISQIPGLDFLNNTYSGYLSPENISGLSIGQTTISCTVALANSRPAISSHVIGVP
jgi:hypothetical protein